MPDKAIQMEVLPAALAENKGEFYWTDRPRFRHQGMIGHGYVSEC